MSSAPSEHKHTNRLIDETSPYLLQHAHNPVDWRPWGDEAFEEARRLGKPVFLSIGYSTCHWCHVMEEESFEDEEIAAFMNEHYVSIKVDREERPDVDAIYMTAVQALTGSGGWPMSVWLTPDREPFFGGTYFPPRDGARGARHGFLTVLRERARTLPRRPRARHARDRGAGRRRPHAHGIDRRRLRPPGRPDADADQRHGRRLQARVRRPRRRRAPRAEVPLEHADPPAAALPPPHRRRGGAAAWRR